MEEMKAVLSQTENSLASDETEPITRLISYEEKVHWQYCYCDAESWYYLTIYSWCIIQMGFFLPLDRCLKATSSYSKVAVGCRQFEKRLLVITLCEPDREVGSHGFFKQKKKSLYPFSYSFHRLILTYTRTSLVVAESFSDHLLSTTNVKREN